MEKTCCDITHCGATCLKDSAHRERSSTAAVFCPLQVWIHLKTKIKLSSNYNTSCLQQNTFLYFYDPFIFLWYWLLFTPSDWLGSRKDLNSLYLNQNGRLVQLVAQQERNIGFVHVQTPANTKAIQIAACVVGWVRREQEYYGACKLLTKAGG